MRTLAAKPKAPRQTSSVRTTTPGRTHFKQSAAVRPTVHVPPTIGNQAVQPRSQAHVEGPIAGLTGTTSPRFGHDFSRIPVHTSVPTAQTTLTGSGAACGQKPQQAEVPAPRSEAKPKRAAPKAKPKTKPKAEEPKKPPKPTITHETKFSAPDGTHKERSHVGVGEEVTFTGSAAGKWTASSGTPSELASGDKLTWTAPERAATVTINLQVATEVANITMQVIEPASITGRKNSELAFPAETAGAGMRLTFIYHPRSVSFGSAQAKEVSGEATGVAGYYKKHYTAAGLHHDSGDSFTSIKENNEDSSQDTAKTEDDFKPYEKGAFNWVIPNNFRVKTEDGDGKKFTEVTQAVEMVDATGKIRITKATTAKVERSPAPAPTPTPAHAEPRRR
jgi:hypothetical protein